MGNPPLSVSTTDYHTAGEPFRIVSGGVGPIPGDTVLDKRAWATENLDRVRRLLVFEPRGHADMYGCFVTEPDDEGGDLGVLFFHNAGFSTACGHGTIAVATWAIESGVVATSEPERRMVLDAPSGRLPVGESLDHSGIVGTRFAGRVVEEAEVAGVPAVITEVEGSARLTGHHRFVLELDDPLGPGFLLR